MAPRTGLTQHNANLHPNATRDKWVNVSWMPHTTLAQTSHVCLAVRSAHASLDARNFRGGNVLFTTTDIVEEEWKLRISIFGFAGLLLVPAACHTRAALVRRRGKGQVNVHTAMLRPTVSKATHDCDWDCMVQIPMRWRDLPRDAYLLFQVLDKTDTVIYQAPMPFFSQYGKMATGLQKLDLQSSPLDPNRNHGLAQLRTRKQRQSDHGFANSSNEEDDEDSVWKASQILDQLNRSEERARAVPKPVHTFGEVPGVPWLDALVKEWATHILVEASAEEDEHVFDEGDDEHASLIVELPTFDIPIMHEETFYPIPQHGASGAVAPLDLSVYRKHAASKSAEEDLNHIDPLGLIPFLDYETELDNPVEDKYRTLAHDLLRGLVDPALKPDREQRDILTAIIDSPSHHPTREEKDLLWRFRFGLVDNRRALTKFLLAVDWTVESEVVQAAELLEQWRKRSPIEVTDALKLLGKHVAFQTNLVREYAIDTLAAAPDSELRLYLLQLVQALKYENMESNEPTTPSVGGPRSPSNKPPTSVSSLANFLISRAAGNILLANYLYWYLTVELHNPNHGSRYREVFGALKARLSTTTFDVQSEASDDTGSSKAFRSIVDSVSKIGSSLRGDTSSGDKERSTKKRVKDRTMWDVLVDQDKFISGVLDIQLRSRDARGKKDAKETELKALLSNEGYDRDGKREPVPLPSTPEMLVNGVRPETAKMFKSALYPALLEFHVAGGLDAESAKGGQRISAPGLSQPLPASVAKEERRDVCKVIVKTGDDLRQDQLIVMMIQLMDGLLKRAALNLCLTPYSILATSPTSGLLQFVDNAMPISQILSNNNGSILQYFQSVAPLKGAKYDVIPDVMSTYVRSLAGYCVITYLLGVGDRHLDNIMLRASGHFFHIDFGFIFGRDPKPLPPAFRLTREMVDGMGGIDSSEYRQFCSLACQAFNSLRKSAGLVLNLLHLMGDAGIEDLSNNPAADAEGVIAKVEERFRLDLTDEQAERHFTSLINDCLAAIAPRVMDVFHSFAVARR